MNFAITGNGSTGKFRRARRAVAQTFLSVSMRCGAPAGMPGSLARVSNHRQECRCHG
jgi:hypothetical protein